MLAFHFMSLSALHVVVLFYMLFQSQGLFLSILPVCRLSMILFPLPSSVDYIFLLKHTRTHTSSPHYGLVGLIPLADILVLTFIAFYVSSVKKQDGC